MTRSIAHLDCAEPNIYKNNLIIFMEIKSRYQWMVKSSCQSSGVDFVLTGSTFAGKSKSQILCSS